ncbi:MAG: hypothetical protein ACREQQ_16665 [Candidatus Binatia bacterium]
MQRIVSPARFRRQAQSLSALFIVDERKRPKGIAVILFLPKILSDARRRGVGSSPTR